MNDWNKNGRIDSEDFFLDQEVMNDDLQFDKRSSNGTALWISLIIAMVIGTFNEVLGTQIIIGIIFFAFLLK